MSDAIQPGSVNGAADSGLARPLVPVVLRMIWKQRRISRAEIARRADLSRSTVSEIITDLLPTGLVAEIGTGASRGGRRPIVLEFQDDAYCLLGFEVGAAHVAVALTDLRGRVRTWIEREHDVRNDPAGTRTLVLELAEAALRSQPHARTTLVGIGIAMPCPVDPKDPDRLSRIVLPAWEGRGDLRGVLAGAFGVPVRVDNDANLGALAERWWGAGRGLDNFAYIKIATGVGSGHVIDGRIYRGASGVAGEIGHVAIDPHGKSCICGLRGCLATFVGHSALLQRVRELSDTITPTQLDLERLEIHRFVEAASAGDPLALEVVQEAAEHLGVAVAGMLNLMNPQAVILGGDLARLGELLLEPLRETVRRRTLVSSLEATEVIASELGPRAIAVGAATTLLEEALDQPRMFPTAIQARKAL